MKKRLLSAALALAMVLTLLPVSAFAAPPSVGSDSPVSGTTNVTYYPNEQVGTETNSGHGIGWYFDTRVGNNTIYHPVNSGFVGAVRNTVKAQASGTWYQDLTALTGAKVASFTMLEGLSIGLSSYTANGTLTIDVNGKALTLTDGTLYPGNTVTNLTVVDRGGTKGTVGGTYNPEGKSGTLTLENVGGNMDAKLTPNGTTSSFTLTVKMTNSSMGNIVTQAAKGSVNAVDSSLGVISLGEEANGRLDSRNSSHDVVLNNTAAHTINMSGSSARLTMTNGASVNNGGVTINSDSGAQVKLGETGSRVSVTGNFTLNAVSGGNVEMWNATVNTGTAIVGYNTTLTARNSSLGALTLLGLGTDTENLKGNKAPDVKLYTNSITSSIKTGATEYLNTPYTIDVNDDSKIGDVELYNAKITVTGAGSSSDTVKLGQGSLTVTGPSASMGNVQLGHTTQLGTVELKVSGSGVDMAGIEVISGNVKTVTFDVTVENGSEIGPINPNGYNYIGQGFNVKLGGKVKNGWGSGTNRRNWLNGSLFYEARVKEGSVTYFQYYTVDQIDQLISLYQTKLKDSTSAASTTKGYVNLVGQTPDTTGSNYVTLQDGSNELVTIFYVPGATTGIKLPAVVSGGPATSWEWVKTGAGGSVEKSGTHTGNESFTLTPADTGTFTLNAKSTGRVVTKLQSAGAPELNKGVTAVVTTNGSTGTINLTGTVDQSSLDSVLIYVTAEGDPEGVVVPIWVTYNNGKATFTSTNTFNRVMASGGGLPSGTTAETYIQRMSETTIQLPNHTTYTLTSSLKVKPVDLHIGGNTAASKGGVKTTSNIARDTVVEKSDRELAMTQMDVAWGSGIVDFSKSPAVLEKFNAEVGNVSASSLAGWRTQAQRQAWTNMKKTGTPTTTQLEETGYTEVWIVLYLDVQLSDYHYNGVPAGINAKLTPRYRIEVRQKSASPTGTAADFKDAFKTTQNAYVVKDGSLGTLTGTPGTTAVQIPVPNGFSSVSMAHQDATYVYNVSVDDYATQYTDSTGAHDRDVVKFNVTHPAVSGEGFGSFVIDRVTPKVAVYKNAKYDDTSHKVVAVDGGDPVLRDYYDKLQAAVDDTFEGDYVVLENGYGDTSITVSGTARKFKILAKGSTSVDCSASGVIQAPITVREGREYAVQLLRDTTVKPTEKPIPITVASATGGYASLSASRADEGETITVTLTPATNYRVGAVTVTAAVKNSTTGATTTTTVSTTAASANSWRFVVPTGATSVTVTPSFAATSTGVTVTVSTPATGGTAVTSAGTNQVAVGTPVTVTVNPSTGYRTMGIYVTNATATRTGANTFSFAVPAGVTNVVVTPRFDRTNGTLFDDVWSYDYFSSAVAWAVGRGITNGDGSVYHFGTGKSCSREDMVTFLWRNAGSPVVTDVRNPFWDVQPGSYYYNAVMWAVKNGVTNGVSTNQFGVGRAVTRGEAVTFLYRAGGSPAASTNSGFYDVPSSEYYAKAVTWAVGKGITNGDGSTVRFNPNGYCLREQIVTFMYRNATGTRA